MAAWLLWSVAVAMFLAISLFGLSFLRGLSGGAAKEVIEAEDVEGLDVFFVCVECGTEFRVTRLGQVQIPRHCGEPMTVVRRPRLDTTGA
jgi:hypothetical protein